MITKISAFLSIKNKTHIYSIFSRNFYGILLMNQSFHIHFNTYLQKRKENRQAFIQSFPLPPLIEEKRRSKKERRITVTPLY